MLSPECDEGVYLSMLYVAELAVELLQEMAPKELGKVDMYWASAVSR